MKGFEVLGSNELFDINGGSWGDVMSGISAISGGVGAFVCAAAAPAATTIAAAAAVVGTAAVGSVMVGGGVVLIGYAAYEAVTNKK